jgi:LysM repeat protein
MFGIRVMLAVALILSAGDVSAGVVEHKVAAGESLASIAKGFYGDRDHYRLAALYNGISDPSRLKVGTRLKLPYSDLVTLKEGQTLAALARKQMGDPSLYTVIARLNGLRDPARVPVGSRIRIPVLIPYNLHYGESLAGIAGEYYGDTRYYTMIAEASGIKDPRKVSAGARLKLPFILNRVARTVKKKSAPPKAAPAPAPVPVVPAPVEEETPRRYLDRLKRAESAYRKGGFEKARNAVDLALEGLKGKDRARGLRLLADLSYAYGNNDHAREHLERAYKLDPGFSPQPAMVNPDLMKLHREAKKKAN